jgi:hypothetical protein
LEHRDTDCKDLGDVSSNEDQALVEAHRIRWSLDAEERAIVEARLLARETDEEIARKSGISPEAVKYYEALFFSVRDRLNAHDWIIKTIHSTAGQGLVYGKEALNEQHRHTVYRLFGYFGGPLVIDATVSTLSPRPRPLNQEDCSEWLNDALRVGIKEAAMMAVASFSKTNMRLLFRAHLDLLRREDPSRNATVGIEKNVEAFLKELECLKDCPTVQSRDAGESHP